MWDLFYSHNCIHISVTTPEHNVPEHTSVQKLHLHELFTKPHQSCFPRLNCELGLSSSEFFVRLHVGSWHKCSCGCLSFFFPGCQACLHPSYRATSPHACVTGRPLNQLLPRGTLPDCGCPLWTFSNSYSARTKVERDNLRTLFMHFISINVLLVQDQKRGGKIGMS